MLLELVREILESDSDECRIKDEILYVKTYENRFSCERVEHTITQGNRDTLIVDACEEVEFIDWLSTYYRLDNVIDQYYEEYDEWRLSKSGNIDYIQPSVILPSQQKTDNLYDYAVNFFRYQESDNAKKIVFLLGEYGLGKTSFCKFFSREYTRSAADSQAPILFTFYLSEFTHGTIEDFFLASLTKKYNINIKFSIFQRLCQSGFFVVMLDAYDQLYDDPTRDTFSSDFRLIEELGENLGKVLITCRLSYYKRHLSGLVSQQNSSVSLAYLAGFGKSEVESFFAAYLTQEPNTPLSNEFISEIGSDWQKYSRLLMKPLNLKMIVEASEYLIEKHPKNDICKIILESTEFDLLDVGYQKWIESLDKSSIAVPQLIKPIVTRALEYGLNRPVNCRHLSTILKDNGISEDVFFKAISKFSYLNLQEDGYEKRIEFPVVAYLEYFWAKFVLEEIQEARDTLNEESLMFRRLLNEETREILQAQLENKDLSSDLANLLGAVRNHLFGSARYLGSNSVSLFCGLQFAPQYRHCFEEIRDSQQSFINMPLRGSDFRYINLEGANFSDSDLQGADFSYSTLNGVKFIRSDLTNADFHEIDRILTSTFIAQNPLRVLAGTSNGGVLFYNPTDNLQKVIPANKDSVNTIALMDRNGRCFAYTASDDGRVACIDVLQETLLADNKSLLISGNGLQAIASNAVNDGLIVGDRKGAVFTIDYDGINCIYQNSKDAWILQLCSFQVYKKNMLVAYFKDQRLVVWDLIDFSNPLLDVQTNRNITGICTKEKELVLAHDNKYVSSIRASDLIVGDSPKWETLCEYIGIVDVKYSQKKDTLFALATGNYQTTYTLGSIDEKVHGFNELTTIDLKGDKVSFSVTSDGNEFSFVGDDLVVITRNQSGDLGEAKRVRALISCQGTEVEYCPGVGQQLKEFFEKRGADVLVIEEGNKRE